MESNHHPKGWPGFQDPLGATSRYAPFAPQARIAPATLSGARPDVR